jgi:hypothetical protein
MYPHWVFRARQHALFVQTWHTCVGDLTFHAVRRLQLRLRRVTPGCARRDLTAFEERRV